MSSRYLKEYEEYVHTSFEMGTTPMDYDDYEEFMLKAEDGAGYAIEEKEGWNG